MSIYVLRTFSLGIVLLALLASAPPARAVEHAVVTGRIYTEITGNPAILDDIRNIGGTAIRVAFEDGGYATQVGLYKNLVALAKARGLETLGLLDSNSAPPYTNYDTDFYRADFAEKVIWHIKNVPDVKGWEIWNEPEVFGFSADPSRYAPLLIAVYERVQMAKANGEIPSDIQIVCAAVVDSKWIAIVFDAPEMRAYRAAHGGAVPFDIANIHPYGGADPWSHNFRSPYTFTQWFTRISTQTGTDNLPVYGDRPFYFTEYGFSTSGFGLDGARTASLRMSESMRAQSRIARAFWYDYHDDAETYGLRSANGTIAGGPKPVYYAFAAESMGAGIKRSGSTTTPTVYDRIVDTFVGNGGGQSVGSPSAEAARSGVGTAQRFYGGLNGEGQITLSDAIPTTARYIYGDFLTAFDCEGGLAGAYGYPISDRFTFLGVDRQNLTNGFIYREADGPSVRIYGDMNANGLRTPADAALALETLVGLRQALPIDSAAGDVYPPVNALGKIGDGGMTTQDVTLLMKL